VSSSAAPRFCRIAESTNLARFSRVVQRRAPILSNCRIYEPGTLPNLARFRFLSGRHGLQVRGRGLHFDEIRRYLPGDDSRTTDWKITQRTCKVHVRVFTEERDQIGTTYHSVMFLIGERKNVGL